ncbi:hypothetical protein [Haloferax sp. DFSO60]|uniref:hypothetical protein n=1 Tax=Haloferax sp. DFSO60 TaxID=3388652 RepID=UPI00397B819A
MAYTLKQRVDALALVVAVMLAFQGFLFGGYVGAFVILVVAGAIAYVFLLFSSPSSETST